jgi:hypothetical protein
MMTESARTNDICIRILPARETGSGTQGERVYQALFYGEALQEGPREIEGADEHWDDAPLRATGRLTIMWRRYQEMLADFYEGIQGAEKMAHRFRDAFSPGIRGVIDSIGRGRPARRVWWACEAPELDDIPWELMFHRPNTPPVSWNCFRGAPPKAPPPILPVRDALQLFWTDNHYTPDWLRDVLKSQLPGIRTVAVSGSLRETLREAAAAGAELLHCCADGVVSLAYEGALYDHLTKETITTAQVVNSFRGSRLSVLGLTPQDAENPDFMPLGGREMPSVYRAFACFGATRQPLPTIATPLGPCGPETAAFWKSFYEALGSSHYLDKATQAARATSPGAPFAVFLRHGQSKLFRPAMQRTYQSEPQQVAFRLNSAARALGKIESLKNRFGDVPDYLKEFAEAEGKLHDRLGAELADWSRLEQEEE